MKKIIPLLLISFLLTGCSLYKNQSNSTNTGIDLTNCKSYFDGCNNCMVENGELTACTLKYCENPEPARCIETNSNEDTDLGQSYIENCKTYFDGCNTCSVENGKITACTEMYCETESTPKCLESTQNTQIANPASTYCIENGGRLEMINDDQGGQSGICHLKDGTSCEEWAYFRGECGKTQDTTTSIPQIDKNCSSYFDGCNNCMVENGEIKGCTKKYCQTAEQPKCLEYTSTEEPTICTMEYAPVCAEVAIQCIQAPCEPIQQTFSNKCMMNANKLAKFLYEGECSSDK